MLFFLRSLSSSSLRSSRKEAKVGKPQIQLLKVYLLCVCLRERCLHSWATLLFPPFSLASFYPGHSLRQPSPKSRQKTLIKFTKVFLSLRLYCTNTAVEQRHDDDDGGLIDVSLCMIHVVLGGERVRERERNICTHTYTSDMHTHKMCTQVVGRVFLRTIG